MMNRIRKAWSWGRDLGRTTLLVVGLIILLGAAAGASVLVARLGAGGAGLAMCQAVRGAATDSPGRWKAKEMSSRQRLKWGLRLGSQLKQTVSIEEMRGSNGEG
jgi:hypothetical protein